MEISAKKHGKTYVITEQGNPSFSFVIFLNKLSCTCGERFPCKHFRHYFLSVGLSRYVVDILHMKAFAQLVKGTSVTTWTQKCKDFIMNEECCICMETLSVDGHVSVAICYKCTHATHKKCRSLWNNSCPTCNEI